MSLIQKDSFRADINALRALAVIGVIGYHFGIPGFDGGFAGVDVFFVISGYLITSQIQQALLSNTFKFGAFYVSRLRRIFPALALMCFAVMVFGWWFIFPNEYIEHAKSAFEALYFGSNNGFIKPGGGGYFEAVDAGLSPLLHTWSLSIEGQFYLVFPILWVIIFKKSREHQRNIVLLALMIAVSYFLYDTQHHTEESFYSLPVRAWEFLAGACLVVLPQRLPSKSAANVASALGLVCLGAGAYLLNASLLWPGYWTLIPIIGTLLVLVARDAASSRWLFNNWLVQRAGDMSYSLYLWHWPLIVFAKQYASIFDRSLTVFEIGGLLLLTVTLAALSWRFVETPIRRNKLLWRSRNIGVSTAIVLIAFWGVWRFVAISYGAPSRLEKYISLSKIENTVKLPHYFHVCLSQQQVIGSSDQLTFCHTNPKIGKKPSFAVFGDSHAHQYYPALIAASMDLQVNGLNATRAACRPTLPGEQPYGIAADGVESCIVFNRKVNQLIELTPSLKTIVIGRLWFEGVSVDLTMNLVKSLLAAGKKVVLLGPVPAPGFNVPQRWFYQQVWGRKIVQTMSVPQHAQQNFFDLNERVKSQFAAQIATGQLVWIDSMRHFCDAKECFYVKDGVNNIVDSNHITEAKALEFVDDFKRALQD